MNHGKADVHFTGIRAIYNNICNYYYIKTQKTNTSFWENAFKQ